MSWKGQEGHAVDHLGLVGARRGAWVSWGRRGFVPEEVDRHLCIRTPSI